MLSYLFFSTILAAVRIASAVHYEDDPRFVAKHTVVPILRTTMLFVKRQSRNLVLEPRTACQALRKMQRLGPQTYQYWVYYTAANNQDHTFGFSTTLTTSATPPHTVDNVVTYQTVRTCRLLQTRRTVLGDIPQECWFVYRMHCPRDDMQIFDPSCLNRDYRPAL